jgi:hypothetical protein
MVQAAPSTERGRSSGVEHNLAKVGVEGSNPFARSSRSSHKLSPPPEELRKGAAFPRFFALTLMVRGGNEGAFCSPDGGESSDLEGWAILPTRFRALFFLDLGAAELVGIQRDDRRIGERC